MSSLDLFLSAFLLTPYLLAWGLDPFLTGGIFALILFFFLFVFLEKRDTGATFPISKEGLLALALGLVISQMNVEIRQVHISEEDFPKTSQSLIFTRLGSLKGGKGEQAIIRAETGPFEGKCFIEKDALHVQTAFLLEGQREGGRVLYQPLDRAAYEGAFNQETWLEGKGISGQVTVEKTRVIASPGPFQTIRNRIKLGLFRRAEAMGGQAGVFFERIFLGRSLESPLGLRDAMKKLGLSHLLAASGLHVNLLFAWGLELLAALNFSRRRADTVLLFLFILYAGLLSFPASIVRAGLFLIFKELAILLQGKPVGHRPFLLAAAFYLAFRPYAAFDLGLLLSFTCALAIQVVEGMGRSSIQSSDFLGDLRTAFWIQLFTLPFLANIQKDLGLVLFLANPLVIPVFGKLFALGLLVYVGLNLPLLGPLLVWGFRIGYGVFWGLLTGLEGLNLPEISLEWLILHRPAYFLVLAAVTGVRLGYIRRWRLFLARLDYWERRALVREFQVFCLSFLIFLAFLSLRGSPPSFTSLDVGQGDAFLLRSSQGNFLFDCGGKFNFKSHKNEEAALFVNKLRSLGVDRLEGVFLSHRDYDHIGNLEGLVTALSVGQIFLPPMSDGGSARPLLPPALKGGGPAGKIPLVSLEEGAVYTWKGEGDNIKIQVVAAGRLDSSERNQDSAVLFLDFGPGVLLTGDREKDLDRGKIRALRGKVDLLKVAHHGSRKGTSRAFLEGLRPGAAVLSYGRNNRYGHPHRELVDRLDAAGVPYYATSSLGDICFMSDGRGGIQVLTKKARLREETGRIGILFLIYGGYLIQSCRRWKSPGDASGWRWRG